MEPGGADCKGNRLGVGEGVLIARKCGLYDCGSAIKVVG